MSDAVGVVTPSDKSDGAKRRQIVDGATTVFLEKGYDAASMGEIARAAGVSKGTLYVYFQDKDALFDAIVAKACQVQAENVFAVDPDDHDIEAVLTRVGIAYATVMCRPEGLSAIRTVIAIAARMADVGRKFYETGPGRGIAQLKAYLEAQVAAGLLEIEDTEIAAAQFIDMTVSALFKPVLFNLSAADPARIERVVGIAVKTFMAAYKAR